jgi:MFS family permease
MHSRMGSVSKERFVPVTVILGLGMFLTLFDVTAVVVGMPIITRELGFAVSGAAWVIDAYSLAFAGALLASGALADRFGRRRAMLSGNAVFLIASIACGVATTGPMLWPPGSCRVWGPPSWSPAQPHSSRAHFQTRLSGRGPLASSE